MASRPRDFLAEKNTRSSADSGSIENQIRQRRDEPETFAPENEKDGAAAAAAAAAGGSAGGQQRRAETSDESRIALFSIITTDQDPGPPPDGGLVAWTQAAMAHLVIFNTWGFVNSFGVFQEYYAGTLGHPPSDISWIGSVQIFLLFAVGTFSGRALDAGLFRPVFVCGCLIHVFGIFMTSLSTEYWQVFLAQGVCVGIGNGILFCPTISLVSTYFSKMKSLAMGIAAAGSATGGLIYPVVVQQLLPKIGFGWTVRVLGLITLCTASLAATFLRSRLPPRKSGPLVEWGAFKEAPYVLYCIAIFLNFMGLYFAFYYVSSGPELCAVEFEADLIDWSICA